MTGHFDSGTVYLYCVFVCSCIFTVEPVREATREEMNAAHVPLGYRDQCASLLIPLNECRRETLYMPFKCQDLRHAYEKCQYDEYVEEVA